MPDYPASIGVTARDDTNTWGENDFDSVTLIEDTCGATITAVLPHETGWEDADPSESNMESTHFALEFPYSANADLTGKQLNLSLKLLEDGRGPLAENGGYAVYLGVVEGETGGWTEGATPWADGMENMPGYSGALYNPGDTVNLSYVVPADDADLDDADIYKLFVRIETKYWGDGTDPVFDYSTAVFELMQLTVTDAL
jgi:hypothetical protein